MAMERLSRDYDYIILDFSVMFAQLSGEMSAFLNHAECVVAPTFACECRHMKKVLPYEIQKRYLDNADKPFGKNLKCIQDMGILDTFGLACCLAGKEKKVLVILANYMLEDEIVFGEYRIDIYNLMEERLIKGTEFLKESKKRRIDTQKTLLTYVDVSEGMEVYTDKGVITLDREMGHGAEALVFQVKNQKNLLAKIFKKDEDGAFVLTAQKLENIRMLKEVGEYWNVSWLALPLEILYADEQCLHPVGYLMKNFENLTFMSDDTLFSGDIGLAMKDHKKTEVKDVLDICIKLVRQVLFLGMNDIYITDYNDKNFGMRSKQDESIAMIDTDSYCSDHYVSDTLTYLNLDSMSRFYEKCKKKDLIQVCNESAYAFTFGRLTLDGTFLPMRKGEFRYASACDHKKNRLNSLKWDSIPVNLQKNFYDIYERKHPASISVLLYELERAKESSFSNVKYADIYKDVLKEHEKNMKEDKVSWEQTVFEPAPEPIVNSTSVLLKEPVTAIVKEKDSVVWPWIVTGIVGWIVSMFVVSVVLTDHMGEKNKELENVLIQQIQGLEQQLAEHRDEAVSLGPVYFEEEYIPEDCPVFEEVYIPEDCPVFEEVYIPDDDPIFEEEYIPPAEEEEVVVSIDENYTGYGSLYTDEGYLIYEGDLVNGKFSGEGIYYIDGTGFPCTWKDGNVPDVGLYINDQEYGNGSWIDNNFYGILFEENQWRSVEIIDGEKFYRGDYMYFLD